MKLLIQKVRGAQVKKADSPEEIVSEIGPGIVAYVGIGRGDSEECIEWAANTIATYNEDRADVLILSQFTLFAILSPRKPSFHRAEIPSIAEKYFDAIVETTKKNLHGTTVRSGIFGTMLWIDVQGIDENFVWVEKAFTE